jgi:hypothetical protein
MGWLELARRTNLAAVTAEGLGDGGPGLPSAPVVAGNADVDSDEQSLNAYNAYLARLNDPAGPADRDR